MAGGAVTDAIATTRTIVAMVAAETAIELIVTTTAIGMDGAGARRPAQINEGEPEFGFALL